MARQRTSGGKKKLEWKGEEDKWVDGGKKDESASEKAEEGEEKSLASECALCNTDNNGTNPH